MVTTLSNLELYRGTTKTLTLTFKDSAGDAIDITGYTIYMTAKEVYDTDATDANAVINETASITDAVNGIATISLSVADTTKTARKYFYDIKYKNSGASVVQVIGTGTLIIYPAVTNR